MNLNRNFELTIHRLSRVALGGTVALVICLMMMSPCLADQPQKDSKSQSAPIQKNGKAKTSAKAQQKTADTNQPLKQIEDVAGLPRVLLIGDSISIGFTLDVRKQLEGKANVHRPPTNCGPTTNGLQNLEKWLEIGGREKRWDVIHFNWGLHDLKYMGPNGENLADPKLATSHRQISPEDYEKNLRELVGRLTKTGAKLIWRNTTPIPEGAKGRVPGDELLYNEVAAKVMKEFNIPTHDLYTFAKQQADNFQKKADVHYTPEGSEQLAKQVSESILKRLSESAR